MSATVADFLLHRVVSWPRLKRTMLVFFVPLMIAAGVPAIVTVIYNFSDISFSLYSSDKKVPAPRSSLPATKVEQLAPSPDVTATPAADIAKAWAAVRTSDDIAELFNFAKTYPATSYADEAWVHMDSLVKNGNLKLASLGDDPEFIGQVLLHKDQTPTLLNKIADDHELDHKYNFGYAIFYSNGIKTVHSVLSNQKGSVRFDPSSLKLTFQDDKSICIKSLSVTDNGRTILNIVGSCFGGDGSVMHLIRVGNTELDAEPLGQSQHGRAWVIGVRGL